MKKSKLAKVLTVSLAALMVFGLASCGGGSGKVSDKDITVISREEGSGTRDAFTELTGVLQDDVDKTVDTAEISNRKRCSDRIHLPGFPGRHCEGS